MVRIQSQLWFNYSEPDSVFVGMTSHFKIWKSYSLLTGYLSYWPNPKKLLTLLRDTLQGHVWTDLSRATRLDYNSVFLIRKWRQRRGVKIWRLRWSAELHSKGPQSWNLPRWLDGNFLNIIVLLSDNFLILKVLVRLSLKQTLEVLAGLMISSNLFLVYIPCGAIANSMFSSELALIFNSLLR